MKELKPCPFCGKIPEPLSKHAYDDRRFMHHFCVNRKIAISIDLNSEEECTRIWNTRADTRIKFSKEKKYVIDGRIGQYELSTEDGINHCFFMDDRNEYEYFAVRTNIREAEEGDLC